MSVRLAIVAEPAAAGLAGLDGSYEWGEATTVAAAETPTVPMNLGTGGAPSA